MTPHRRSLDYRNPLDNEAQDWRRVRIWLEDGRVRRFVVQYETFFEGQMTPVVRYDTAHGFAHRDEMFRHKGSVKTSLPDHLTLDEALMVAIEDIRRNWATYRRQFEEAQ